MSNRVKIPYPLPSQCTKLKEIKLGLQNSKPQELELEVLGTNNAYPAIQKTLKLRQWYPILLIAAHVILPHVIMAIHRSLENCNYLWTWT